MPIYVLAMEQWTIETGGERVSRRFELVVQHDDDVDNDMVQFDDSNVISYQVKVDSNSDLITELI